MQRDHDVVLDGRHLHYRETGPVDAPVIVALHGAGLDATSWDGVAEHLADDRRVLALDQRGHGPSDPADGYAFEHFRDDVIAFLDALGLDTVVLLGHSLGGTIATLVAESRPERLQLLVLEDTPPPRRIGPRPRFPDQAPEHLTLDPRAWTAIMSQLADPDPRWWDDLTVITPPTLVVGGGSTSHVPQTELARACERIPGGRLVTVEGAGHQVHATRENDFLGHVRAALREVRTTGRRGSRRHQ